MIRKAVILFLLALVVSTHAQEAVDVRAQLTAIDYRHAKDMNEYLMRCDEVRALLPKLEEFYQHSSATISRLRIEHKDNAQFVKLADFYSSMNKKDEEGLAFLRREMALALQMAQLSTAKRESFFKQRILPVQQNEDLISAQKISMALEARRDGIPLPDDVSRKLGPGH